MTSTRGEQDFAQVWLAFVQAIRQLLEMMYAQQDREYLEPYRGWSGEVLESVSREQFVGGLVEAWLTLREASPETAYLLRQELGLYPPVVDAIRVRFPHPGKRTVQVLREGLGIGKTGLDSVLDLLEHLPLMIKGPLKVLGELIGIMTGRGGEE
jgi:hypothetical protein